MITTFQTEEGKKKKRQCKTTPFLTKVGREAKMSLNLPLCACISFELS